MMQSLRQMEKNAKDAFIEGIKNMHSELEHRRKEEANIGAWRSMDRPAEKKTQEKVDYAKTSDHAPTDHFGVRDTVLEKNVYDLARVRARTRSARRRKRRRRTRKRRWTSSRRSCWST